MEQKKYEGFTLSLALVDAIPVLFFGLSCIMLGIIFKSTLFIIGAAMCFLGGAMKVTWKIILALKKKDIKILNRQFRYLMISGFVLIIVSVIINIKRISIASILASMVMFPQVIFFALWIAGMIGMMFLAKKLDSSVAKNNWIEQCVNGIAQICLFIALIIAG